MAERVDEYAPVLGDLICYSRERYKLTYEKLPRRRFIGHCDIVVARDKAQISVIGGNVESCRHNEACASYHRWAASRRRRPSA
jgi:hypothetical protein